MNKAISRRLAVLQQIVDRGKPCKVVVAPDRRIEDYET